ncbi:hypothetical protein U1Q18_033270 [Sarracenia purpurea var. burkii]
MEAYGSAGRIEISRRRREKDSALVGEGFGDCVEIIGGADRSLRGYFGIENPVWLQWHNLRLGRKRRSRNPWKEIQIDSQELQRKGIIGTECGSNFKVAKKD